MWKAIKSIFWITILLAIGIAIIQSASETRSLKELRHTDPDKYLAAVEEKDETKWLLALKDLKPDQYETELQARIKQAKALPASQISENLKAYKRLAKLEPGNEGFAEKVKHYQERQSSQKKQNELCNDSKVEAYQKAGQLVKAQLKAPRTAKLSSYGQTSVKLYKGCEYEVIGYADAQNGFGAMIRSNYSVHLKRTETGWAVKDIRIQ